MFISFVNAMPNACSVVTCSVRWPVQVGLRVQEVRSQGGAGGSQEDRPLLQVGAGGAQEDISFYLLFHYISWESAEFGCQKFRFVLITKSNVRLG